MCEKPQRYNSTFRSSNLSAPFSVSQLPSMLGQELNCFGRDLVIPCRFAEGRGVQILECFCGTVKANTSTSKLTTRSVDNLHFVANAWSFQKNSLDSRWISQCFGAFSSQKSESINLRRCHTQIIDVGRPFQRAQELYIELWHRV